MKIHFDGYNNIIIHKQKRVFCLIEYVRDRHYCGGDEIFAVRLGINGEDFSNHLTMKEASRMFNLCHSTYMMHGIHKSLAEIFDLIISQAKADKLI